jgi:sorting nexin-4
MTGASFIVYQILTMNPSNPSSSSPLYTVLRRYSEFESLRKSLQRLHPTAVVPPIPEKHSLTDYATKQSRTKEDPAVIGKRRRMLMSFLNRVVRHPVLGQDHMVHGFLEPGSWNEVLVRAAVPKSSGGGLTKKIVGRGSLVSPGGSLAMRCR